MGREERMGGVTRDAQGRTGNPRVSNFEFRFPRFRPRVWRWTLGVAAALTALTSSVPALAQGCVMCYTSAAAAKAGAVQALRSGILILLLPPLVMFVAIFVVIYRCRNRFIDSPEWSAEHERELGAMLAQVESSEAQMSEVGRSESPALDRSSLQERHGRPEH